jgi:RNA polymerase sigma factor (sigma-70 family)
MTPRNLSERILVHPVLRAQPDRRLVTLAREGHEAAIDEIIRRYRPALKRYAASIVPADRADDIVQDTLARALPGITTGDAEIHLRPWLYTITRNTALNALRDAGPPTEQLDENFDGVEQPPQAFERREQVRSLLTSLRDLPEAQRLALVKREMEGLSHTEIGVDLGVSVGAARQLIYRARGALREGIGALVPMPLLRELLEGGSASGVAAAGGGTIAVKTAVAMLATGAALTTGVVIGNSHHNVSSTIAVRPRGGAADSGTRVPPKSFRHMEQTAFAADKHEGTRTNISSAQMGEDIGGGSQLAKGGKSTTGGPGEGGDDTHQGTGNGHSATGNSDGSGEGTSGQSGDSPQGGSGSGDSLARDNSGESDSGTQPSGEGGSSSGGSGSSDDGSGSGGSHDGMTGGDTATTQTIQD